MEISLLTAVLHLCIFSDIYSLVLIILQSGLRQLHFQQRRLRVLPAFSTHFFVAMVCQSISSLIRNSLNDHLFKLTGVQHVISSAYHPQTNGLDERFNQTLQRALIKMIEENQCEWDKFLDSVLFAYRTSKRASTQLSLFFLLYGREPRLPIELSISKTV